MVNASQGLGGPQPAEVARMLAEEQEKLSRDRAWLDAARGKLAAASKKLDETFARLRNGK